VTTGCQWSWSAGAARCHLFSSKSIINYDYTDHNVYGMWMWHYIHIAFAIAIEIFIPLDHLSLRAGYPVSISLDIYGICVDGIYRGVKSALHSPLSIAELAGHNIFVVNNLKPGLFGAVVGFCGLHFILAVKWP